MKPGQTKQLIFGKSNKANRFTAIKKYTFLAMLFTITLLQTNAQRSSLVISTLTNPNIVDGRGGIVATTAALRKERVSSVTNSLDINQTIKKVTPVTAEKEKSLVNKKETDLTTGREEVIKEEPVTEKEKIVTSIKETAPKNSTIPADFNITYTTRYTTYDMPGNTATLQLTSLQASFKFIFGSTARGALTIRQA